MQNVIPWKIIVIFGSAGAFLSVLMGIIGGVGFGTILFRGFFFAILSAGLGYAVRFAVGRFLPELLTSGEQTERQHPSDYEEGGEGRGGTVDMLAGEEGIGVNPYSPVFEGQPADSADQDAFPLSEGEEPAELAEASDEGFPELGSDGPEELAEPDKLPENGTANGRGRTTPAGDVDFATLDKLPTLDSFAGSFASGRFAGHDQDGGSGQPPAGRAAQGSFFERSKDASGFLGNAIDPASMAKAIHTMLKKDQKG